MGSAGYQLSEQILADSGVDALIYSSSVMAIEGLTAMNRIGRRPGRDLVVATMDDELRSLDLSPFQGQICLARSSLRDAGRALATELVRRCEGESEPRGTTIPVSFHLQPGLDASCIPPDWNGAAINP
jgi:LacI family transcriptional regulator